MNVDAEILLLKEKLQKLEKYQKDNNSKESFFNPYKELIGELPKGFYELVYSVVNRDNIDKASFLAIKDTDSFNEFLNDNFHELMELEIFYNYVEYFYDNVAPSDINYIYDYFDEEYIRTILNNGNLDLIRGFIEKYIENRSYNEQHNVQQCCSTFYCDFPELIKYLELSYCLSNEFIYSSDLEDIFKLDKDLLDGLINDLDASCQSDDNILLKELIKYSSWYSEFRSKDNKLKDLDELFEYSVDYQDDVVEFILNYKQYFLNFMTKEELFDKIF